MAFIEWSPGLSVGVREIDEQHKKLFGSINRLNDAMVACKGKDAVGQLVKELVDYTEYHFKTEEKYMQQFGYAGFLGHQGEHNALIEKVKQLVRELAAGKILIVEAMNFLKERLLKHIQGTDKQYGPFFNEKGLK